MKIHPKKFAFLCVLAAFLLVAVLFFLTLRARTQVSISNTNSDAGADADLIENIDLIANVDANAGAAEANEAAEANADSGQSDKDSEYIHIPAGSFVLHYDTEAHHEGDTVTLTAFSLKKTPVTAAEFQKCVEAGACGRNNYRDVSENTRCNYNRGETWLNHPMNCVNLSGAREYCKWSGGRLPTEEEWEYASTHDGTKHLDTSYPWGDSEDFSERVNYNEEIDSTTAVGKYSPKGDSPLGLVDMVGNVFEWIDSAFSPGNRRYVQKGGSWVSDEYMLTVDYRFSSYPDEMGNNMGFRCAK